MRSRPMWIWSRRSFAESALRRASCSEISPAVNSRYSDWSKVTMPWPSPFCISSRNSPSSPLAISSETRGVFTSTLLDVLTRTGIDVSYADLFMRCRAAVRKRADNQDPQFETHHGFHAYAGFLGGQPSTTARRHSVYFEDERWRVDCGALHGLPTDPDQQVALAVYAESDPFREVGVANLE